MRPFSFCVAVACCSCCTLFSQAFQFPAIYSAGSVKSSCLIHRWGTSATALTSTWVTPPCQRNPAPVMNIRTTRMMAMAAETGLAAILDLPDEKIMAAVEKAGYRVIPQDVAAVAGIDITKAEAGLVQLAGLADGALEVTQEGDLVYNFPRGFRNTLRTRSGSQQFRELWEEKIWPVLFYCVRVGFGVVLIASIALIFTTIAVISSSSSSDDDNRRGRSNRGGGGMSFSFGPRLLGPSPFDFFYYRPTYGYYSTPAYRRRDPSELGFLESVFSYIFGDGNPNRDIETRRLQLIATVIRENGGAVTAEQLAPYLDVPPPRREDSMLVDENFVLPAVSALRGRPEVTEDGDIIYVFPELQTSAVKKLPWGSGGYPEDYRSKTAIELKNLMVQRGIPSSDLFEKEEMITRTEMYDTIMRKDRMSRSAIASLPPVLDEQQIDFSVATDGQKLAAGGLGAVNLFGALYLARILPLYTTAMPGITGVAQALLPFLVPYAIAFNVIPIARYFWNKRENSQIEQRNAIRRQWAAISQYGGETVTRKIEAAKRMAGNIKLIRPEDVSYTTAKSLSEQYGEGSTGAGIDPALESFDKRLKD